MVQPLWKTAWQLLTKLNILSPYSPPIALLGIYPEELKTYIHTKIYTWILIVVGSFIHNCPNLEGTKISFNKQMDKSTVVHPDNGILFNIKKMSY